MRVQPFVRGGESFRRLYSDGGVPLSWGKHYHLIEELVNTSQQVLSVLGFVSNVMEDLDRQGQV